MIFLFGQKRVLSTIYAVILDLRLGTIVYALVNFLSEPCKRVLLPFAIKKRHVDPKYP
jgi:hypothetical protein